ncbi:hypothetical protein F4814DRAFT_416743 [Daldinia grandis]|nr:hypothetical protein F4814DRAFT_416743 [Daldinia grandis]
MARKNKKRQTQLIFESTGASSSLDQATPGNVRFSKDAGANSSLGRASPAQATRSPGRSKKRQSKLRGTVGLSQNTTSPARSPSASFMPKLHDSKRPVMANDSDSGTEEVPDQEEEDNVPAKSSQSVSTRLQNAVIDDKYDEYDDDDELVAPPSTLKRRRPPVIALDDSDEDEDDDCPIVPPSSLKRPRPRFIELENSSDSDVSPVKKRKTSISTPGRLKRPTSLVPSSPTKRGAPKGHRSEKQKKMELLRRRRAGEKIEKLTSSEEDSDEEKRGLYDTDPEEEFVVLKDFDDEDSEGEEQEKEEKRVKRLQRKENDIKDIGQEYSKGDIERQEDGDDDDKDLEDFISDDDDTPLGAPANLDIPLEFTAQAHRPLKDQFPYVIEWLVHNRINPAFERNDPVYSNAWRKLDDEVRALASSKFASAAWKAEFYRTLKGRPKMEAYEMDRSERSGGLYDTCDACGRSNHPASFRIIFQGHPYYKSTLADVESDTEDNDSNKDEDEDEDGDNESNAGSIDTQGMTLPTVTREWHVGVVCCSNAETAHSLIHWKHALKEWVEERLEDDGWMAAHKLKERERLKARKRRDLADGIVDGWREKGIVAALYKDFKSTLESARNKTTGGRGRGRFR